ncbi:MAG: patatin-like phospholipase family protein [Clostridia bacterium]
MKFPNLWLGKNKKVKIGLALGGGGARGFVHLGAIKAFMEYGLQFDLVAGTSAGALVGAFYCAGLPWSKLIDLARELNMKDVRTSPVPFLTSKTDGIEKIIIDLLGNIGIQELKSKFVAVATDLISTKECVITKGDLAKAVAGSCCVPYVFYPVVFDDKHLVDGGLHNTIPADIPKLFGCDYVVAIDANKSRTYGTTSMKLVNVVTASFRILMENNARKGYKYADVMLQPETKSFRSTKKEGFEEMIEEGYREAIDKMPEIIKLFNQKPKSNRFQKHFEAEFAKDEKSVTII